MRFPLKMAGLLMWIQVDGVNVANAATDQGCGAATVTLAKARHSLSDAQRLSAMEALRSEIETLASLNPAKTQKPRAYWQTCMERKRETLNMHMNLASPRLRSHPDFNMILSQVFEMRGDRREASHFAELALQGMPQNHAWRLRCLELWLKSQDLKSAAKGSLTPILKRVDAYLLPILQDPQSPTTSLRAAREARALFLESVARFTDAVEEWEKILELNPKDIKHRRKLAAWELSRRRLDDASRHLDEIVKLNSADLGAQKRLIEIYLSRKDKESARRHLRQALAHHPADAELLTMWKSLGALAG